MKYKKNSCFFITIEILFFIVNIKNIKGRKIECNECEYDAGTNKCKKDSEICSSDCRPHLYDGICYDCSSVFLNNPTKLYSIKDNECVNSLNYEYMISETNEVVSKADYDNKISDLSSYQMYFFGNIIYRQCPAKTIIDNTKSNHQCKCDNNLKVYMDNIFGIVLYRCVESCPNGYYYFDVGMNGFVCTILNSDSSHKHIRSDNFLANNCDSGQPLKYNVDPYIYCLNNCPAIAPFFYNNEDTETSNQLTCLETCYNQDFYFSDTKECTKKCIGYKSLIDIKTSTFICDKSRPISDNNYNCPQEFPYAYGDSCLRNCCDTNNDYFSSAKGHFNSDLKKPHIASLVIVIQKKNVLLVVKRKQIMKKNIMIKIH